MSRFPGFNAIPRRFADPPNRPSTIRPVPSAPGGHQLLLVLSTAPNRLPLWHVVRSDEILLAPPGLIPPPGVPMTQMQRATSFDLNVLTDGGCILRYGPSRIFGRLDPGASCCFGFLSHIHVIMLWHRLRANGRRPRDIYNLLIELYPERPFPPPELVFPIPEVYYAPGPWF